MGALDRDPRNGGGINDESRSGAGAGETRERSDCESQLYSCKTSHKENTLEKEKLLKDQSCYYVVKIDRKYAET